MRSLHLFYYLNEVTAIALLQSDITNKQIKHILDVNVKCDN